MRMRLLGMVLTALPFTFQLPAPSAAQNASAQQAVSTAAQQRRVDPKVLSILTPTGKLRAGLYTGTPTSILVDGENRGVGFELGKALADTLGVPYDPHIFKKNAEVLEAIRSGTVDVAFTNASAERAKEMDFGPAYLEIELGYLVSSASTITAIADVDSPGRHIGVTKGSSSEGALPGKLRNANVIAVATFDDGARLLREGGLDAYATGETGR